MPILLTFQHIGPLSLPNPLCNKEGLTREELGEKLICFSGNGNYLFQVCYIEVTE